MCSELAVGCVVNQVGVSACCRGPALVVTPHVTVAVCLSVGECAELLPAPCVPSCLRPLFPQLLQALHRFTRLVAFRDLSSAEAILALFPENFHQNLKNLLTKIVLEHV